VMNGAYGSAATLYVDIFGYFISTEPELETDAVTFSSSAVTFSGDDLTFA
jgi:hypothetical protein